MIIQTEAIYEQGVLRLTQPVPLKERQRVAVTIVQPSDQGDATVEQLSTEEFCRLLGTLAYDEDLPTLPTDFSRADIYAYHD